MLETLSNWNRWGGEDERGTLNLLTPQVLLKAKEYIKQGKVYSLSYPIRQTKVPVFPGRNSALHFMTIDGGDYKSGIQSPGGVKIADDYIVMPTHGTTHVDGLGHVWTDEQIYNGHDQNNIRSTGAKKCGVEKIEWIVGRGILLDIALLKGVQNLDPGYVITPEDIMQCLDVQKVEIQQGDIILLRTGFMKTFETQPETFYESQPGIGIEAARFLAKQDIVGLGVDNLAVEPIPMEEKAKDSLHVLMIRELGIYLMEMLNLDEFAKEEVYEFFFVATPLKIRGGVGSPINPLAIL
ncbi:cyclase family protein [Neobacillus sp. 114]|uniref:cyclase family protein n=1 Tax=Neobacillus sp. 114 TaxID=3048535 RepID=UPI0024C21690|nr:cyclase family protein [Neobacillus sp. 114]